MDTKEQIKKAQHLYKAGEYKQARDLLAQVDHPKAKAWVEQIDSKHGTKPRRKISRWRMLAFVLIMGCIVVGVGSFIAVQLFKSDRIVVQAELACSWFVSDILIEETSYVELSDDASDIVIDTIFANCETWINHRSDDVINYCVDQYKSEAADYSVKQEHLIDCILERSDEMAQIILNLDIHQASRMIATADAGGPIEVPTPPTMENVYATNTQYAIQENAQATATQAAATTLPLTGAAISTQLNLTVTARQTQAFATQAAIDLTATAGYINKFGEGD